MNKEIIYNGGYVTVIDENGVSRPVDYRDNLDEILLQENLIELIEISIAELEEKIGKTPLIVDFNQKGYKPFLLPVAATMSFFSPVLSYYCLENTDVFTTTVNSIFGPVNEGLLLSYATSVILIPFSAIFEGLFYRYYKLDIKYKKGLHSELEALKKAIEKEKQILEDLNKPTTSENENKAFRVVAINNEKITNALNAYLNLYFALGSDGEKYYRYYIDGKLEEVLTAEGYNEYCYEQAKEYLEEKGPTLVRKKQKKNKERK